MSFDSRAKTWDDDPKKVERAQVLADRISEFAVDKNLKDAMEFGCGTGLLSFCLKDQFQNITLADTSKGMIEVLQDKIMKESVNHFSPVLLENGFNFQSDSFDITYSLLVLHHVKELDETFYLFQKILKPGGYLCIADLVEEQGDFHNAEDSKHVHHGFNREQLEKKLEGFGFKGVDYKLFLNIEKTTESGEVKKFPLFLMILEKII